MNRKANPNLNHSYKAKHPDRQPFSLQFGLFCNYLPLHTCFALSLPLKWIGLEWNGLNILYIDLMPNVIVQNLINFSMHSNNNQFFQTETILRIIKGAEGRVELIQFIGFTLAVILKL